MNKTLHTGLRLLELLAASAEAQGVSDLARRLELPKSHVHRLLQSLVAGYVHRVERRYRIGYKPLSLSADLLERSPLREAALPALDELAERSGASALCSVLDGDSVVVIAAAYHRGQRVGSEAVLGRRMGLLGTASGRLLLAFAEPARRANLLAGAEVDATQGRRLAALVDEIRIQDLAFRADHERHEPWAAAVPVREQGGAVIAAIGLSCSQRDRRRHGDERLCEAIRDAADRTSYALGYRSPANAMGVSS